MEQKLSTRLCERQVAELINLCRAQHKWIHVESAVMWSCPTKLPFDAARRRLTQHK
jgi:hypothetical protein